MRRRFILGLIALLLIPVFRYGWAIGIEFINDDFFFLERAHGASFLDNWGFGDALGNFYRPLSRNLYFWLGLRLLGREAAPYHLVNLALFAAGLVLAALLVRRLIADALALRPRSPRAEAGGLIAALLFALHPAAGAPASWVCGVQDLAAVDLALAAFLAHLTGRRLLYPVLYAGALLCKETAALLFLLMAFWDLVIAGTGWRRALTRQLPAAALFVIWLAGNPWLPWNELGHEPGAAGAQGLLGPLHPETMGFALRALLLVQPTEGFRWPYGTVATAGQLILVALVLALALFGREGGDAAAGPTRQRRRAATKRINLAVFATLWSFSGIVLVAAVADPFIHYAFYPALGLSLLIAVTALPPSDRSRGVLARPLSWLLPGGAALLFLAGAGRVHQPSLCDAHNIRRASSHLSNFRQDLFRLHPVLPESSRVYLWNIPYWIGFQSADGPALRVWYGDPTLTGRFLSTYTPEPERPTFFFGHDDSMRLIEMVRGLPDPALADPPPIYTAAHNDLGSALSAAGEREAALIEWRKVLEVDADFADAVANLGMTLVRLERFAEALPVLEHAARLEPAAADVQLDLGRACLNLGHHRQALEALETFLRLRPDEPEREQVERVIEELRAEIGGRD